MLIGTGFLWWNDENVLKSDSDNGCTTLQIHYKTLNLHLKLKIKNELLKNGLAKLISSPYPPSLPLPLRDDLLPQF